MVQWAVSCTTVAALVIWIFLRRRAEVGDRWRNFTSYPIDYQFVTGGGSSVTTTTYYNKAASISHRFESSIGWVFFHPAIFIFAPFKALVPAIAMGFVVPFLFYLGVSEVTCKALMIPPLAVIGYLRSLDSVLFHNMESQASKERGVKHCVIKRESIFDLFVPLPAWLMRRIDKSGEKERH